MTEKRFTFADGFKIVAVKDNGEIMNSVKVVDILNIFNDENEQLKKGILNKEQVILDLKNDIKRCRKRISDLSLDESILKKENEQLKYENKNLKAILNDFINICNRLQNNPDDKQILSVVRDMLQNMGVDLE